MQLGNEGQQHGHRMAAHRYNSSGPSAEGTRGERLMARLDSDGDGKLGLSELEGTRFGKKLSVDRFARLDANRDGALDAGEIDAQRGRGQPSPESVVVAKMADFLTEKTEPQVNPLTSEVLRRLDGDQDGNLSSDEIAGTRLADAIGDGFGGFDTDENAGLSASELNAFIENEILGLTQPSVPDETAEVASGETVSEISEEAPVTEEVGDVAAADGAEAVEDASDIAAPEAPTFAGPGSTETSSDTASLASLEAALATLKANPTPATAFDAIGAFYEQVRGILDAA